MLDSGADNRSGGAGRRGATTSRPGGPLVWRRNDHSDESDNQKDEDREAARRAAQRLRHRHRLRHGRHPYDVRLAQERFPKIHFHPLREHAGLALQQAG